MRKSYNPILLMINAFVLQLVVTLPCYLLADVVEPNDRFPNLLYAVCYSAIMDGVILLLVALTLLRQLKIYKVFEQNGDKLRLEVSRRGIWNLEWMLIVVIVLQSLVIFLFLSVDGVISVPAIFVPAAIILTIVNVFLFFYARNTTKTTILWGEKTIAINGKKGQVYIFRINDINGAYKRRFRKNPMIKYTFSFSNGSFDVYDATFRGKCLAAYLNLKFDSVCHGSVNEVTDKFYGFPRKYSVTTGSVEDLSKARLGALNWKAAEKKIAKEVRSESRAVSFFGIFVVALIAGIIFGVAYSLAKEFIPDFGFYKECTIAFWSLAAIVWFVCFRTEILSSNSKIYSIEGEVTRKHIDVSSLNIMTDPDLLVDVKIDSEVVSNVFCDELHYKSFEPGKSKVMLVRTKLSPAKFYFDEE